MEEGILDSQESPHMFHTTKDAQEILSKFTKIFKLEASGLTPPTFTPQVISNLSKVINQAKTVSMHNSSICTSNYIACMAPYIPQIVELSSQNFLSRTIREFQTEVSILSKDVAFLIETTVSLQDPRSPIFRIETLLNDLIPKVLVLSNVKVLPTSFNAVQQSLHSIQAEISSLRETQNYEQYQSIATKINDLDCSIKHIVAAHSFVSIANSLQDSIRHFTFDDSVKKFVLNSIHSKLCPSRPRDGQNSDLASASELLHEFIHNPENENEEVKEKFIEEMNVALKKELNFETCTPGIENILFVILTIQPPQDVAKKVFTKCSNFYFAAARAITQLYKLPEYAYSTSEIEPFVLALDLLKQASESIIKARKKPVGWSAQDTKHFMMCTEPFTKLDTVLKSALDIVQRANEAIGKQIFCANIGKVIPKQISLRFFITEECPKSTPQLKKFNTVRGLALSQRMLTDLSEKHIILRDVADGSVCIHPADLTHLFTRIRGNILQVEKDLFRMSLDNYNENPTTKNGSTMIMALSEVSRKLEEFILTMESLPVEIASLREISIILYEQGFSMSIDSTFTEINKDINLMFKVYQVFEQLDTSGSANISTCAQLSFIATAARELSANYPDFTPLADYFRSLNVFDLNMDDILPRIDELRELATNYIMKWTCASFINKFSQQYKSTYTAANILRNEQLEPVCTKLLGQLTSWIGKLPRAVPKQGNIREFHIRMTILKSLLKEYLSNHPECQLTVQFEQIFSTIDLIGDFRHLFELKNILKATLSFIERISTGNPKESIVEEVLTEKGSQMQSFGQGIAQDSDEFDILKMEFNESELKEWESFAAVSYEDEKTPVHTKYSVYTKEIIRKRLRVLFEEFVTEWPKEECTSFAIELQLLKEDIYSDKEIVSPKNLLKKIIDSLKNDLDTLLAQLIEFNPPSRGRGYPREVPTHPKSQQIGELHKTITSIKDKINCKDFGWIIELFDSRCTALDIFEITDVTNEGRSPVVLIRKITNKAFAFYRFVRCIIFMNGGHTTLDADLMMMKLIVAGLSKKTRFVRENSPLLLHEIDQVAKSNTSSNYYSLNNTYKVLMRSRALYDVKELVTKIDNSFFNFMSFFSKLPPGYSTLSTFMHSDVYDLFIESTHSIVVRFVDNSFNNRFITDHFHHLLHIKKEFAAAPVTVNWELMDEYISTVFALQHLVDVSIAFDREKPLIKLSDSPIIRGQDFLAIELLIFKLQNEVESLVQSKPNLLCNLFIDLTKVLTAMRGITSKFGPRKASNKGILLLRDQWSDFVENFASLPMEKFTEVFVHISNQIIDGVQENVESSVIQNDLRTVIFLVKQYSFFPSQDVLEKIQFGFIYIAALVSNTETTRKTTDLPFFQLQIIISAMLSMYKIRDLIPIITKVFEHSLNCTLSHRVPEIVGRVEKQRESETVIPKPSVLLEKQLSFSDQTSVGHMTAALFDANLADQEKVLSLPILRRSIEREKILNENGESCNRLLEEIDRSLKERVSKHEESGSTEDVITKRNSEADQLFMNYSQEMKARDADMEYRAAKRKYDATIEGVTFSLGTGRDLKKTVRKLETIHHKSEIMEGICKFNKKIETVSSAKKNLVEMAKGILEIDD